MEEIIVAHKKRSNKKVLKIIAYRAAEVITAILIFVFGYLWFKYL